MLLARRHRPDDPGAPASTVGLIARFTAAGIVVLLGLAGLLAFIARQSGTDQAVRSAAQTTAVTARGVVEPKLDPAVVAQQPAALQAFNTTMHRYVLEGSLVRVKVWNAQGVIVYSDISQLIGKRFTLDD